MAREISTGSVSGLEVTVGLDFHKIIDYDRRKMRSALRAGAALITKEARRIISRRAISAPGEFPGLQTGRMKRAIGVVARGSKGGWIRVGPRTIPGSEFYPSFLISGSPSTGLAPRANFMAAALNTRAPQIRTLVRAALRNALVPR